MTDRCDSLSNNRRTDYSPSERACEPSGEDKAAAEIAQRQAAEREAEVRRNDYYASGTDEGGRSSHASSDPGKPQTSSTYDQRDANARIGEYTKRIDPPLQDDPAGNALVGAAAGGLIGGVKAASVAGGDAAAGAIAKVAADTAAKGLVKSARNEIGRAAIDASRRGLDAPEPLATPSIPSVPAAPASPAGRSSPNATSEAVPEQVQSSGPRIPEVLSGAPVRIRG